MKRAEALVARGAAHFNAGRPREALADFRAAFRLGHDTADARYFAAHAHLALDQIPEALEAFSALILADPNRVAAYLDLANLLHQQGRLLDAAMTLRAALKQAPGHEAALRRLRELTTGQTGKRPTHPVHTRARRPAYKRAGVPITNRIAPMVPAALAAGKPWHDFRLRSGPVRVKRLGNLPIELLALIAGVKPVIHLTARAVDMPELESLRARLGLKLLVFSRSGGRGEERFGVMLGRDAAVLRVTAKLWDRENGNPGVRLGYPACCTRWYYRHADDPGGRDIVQAILRHTKNDEALPFALNNVFYFFSRVSSVQEGARRQKLVAMNPGLDLDLLNLIPWHPCAYDCAPSRAKAAKIWATAKKIAPDLAAALKDILARPVIFWDWSRFAVLAQARMRSEGVRYSGLASPFSLLEPGLVAKLEQADLVRKTPQGLELWKGDKRLGLLAGSPAPVLLRFGA